MKKNVSELLKENKISEVLMHKTNYSMEFSILLIIPNKNILRMITLMLTKY